MSWKIIDRTLYVDDMEIGPLPDEMPDRAIRRLQSDFKKAAEGNRRISTALDELAAELHRRWAANTGKPWPYKQ